MRVISTQLATKKNSSILNQRICTTIIEINLFRVKCIFIQQDLALMGLGGPFKETFILIATKKFSFRPLRY